MNNKQDINCIVLTFDLQTKNLILAQEQTEYWRYESKKTINPADLNLDKYNEFILYVKDLDENINSNIAHIVLTKKDIEREEVKDAIYPNYENDLETYYVSNISTDIRYRKQGIAAFLINKLIEIANNINVNIDCVTFPSNPNLSIESLGNLYKKCGFSEYFEIKDRDVKCLYLDIEKNRIKELYEKTFPNENKADEKITEKITEKSKVRRKN